MERRISLPIQGRQAPVERADAARNRRRILAAARKLLAKRPIDSIGMDELARAAGVGKGTIFRRFGDRSALCMALLDENERELQESVLADFHLPKGASAYQRLTVFLDALFAFHIDNARVLVEAETYRHPEERFAQPPYVWRRRELVRRIQRAKDAGDISPGDTAVTSELIMAGLGAPLLLWQVKRFGRNALHQRVMGIWQHLLQYRERTDE
ncbi:TetR/AcrR family transcriptional regulator [Pendulispora albinea]|uniref:TetR/AcrR family transcriptional regulator n=1 Tax=Pendulispora albinea TaxID=2741071 RepID=A0ABZ2M4X4_9BACT